ncbi:MAG: excinuclease ABC subunit UvrC [Casimicrobiaceae bacterium]|nr:excinuclease ABC subunit UvrC [Casimicrobiaceae bacterium]MDW8312365.1 excinuclease ABC subunit UvrC [Burkholderiales bacterium]
MSETLAPAIAETLRTLPTRPGVYRMLGRAADGGEIVLYVGKAKNLKARVSSYFVKGQHGPRIARMLEQVERIEVTVTRSEAEALLLENNLIKTLEPRYNILFRDDKSYPYLCLTGEAFPQLRFFRGKPDKRHRYFGPFPSAAAVREGIQTLQKLFQLRTCENTVFAHRSRPCMLAQIGRCSAPCVGAISEADYARDVADALRFLSGRGDEVLSDLQQAMEEAAAALAFERAARLRDKIARLARLQSRQFVSSLREHDVDVIALVQAQGLIAVNVTMIRGGQHVGDRSHFPVKNAPSEPLPEEELAELLERFLLQHYLGRDVPAELVVSHAIASEALASALAGDTQRPIEVNAHPSGLRRAWLDMAQENARLAIAQRLRAAETGAARLQALIDALELPESTQRIECFDVSHTMGEATVASCVVFDGHALVPAQYRRMNIAVTDRGDDYAALREALTRRAARIAAGEVPRPDLWIIDGGQGQVNVAARVLAEAGLHDIALIGSAKGQARKKGQEQIVFPPDADGVVRPALTLPSDHPGLHLIQQLQDEAHRFAITGHRARRAKAREHSLLDEIDGIGPRKKAALLRRFGSVRGIAAASVEDLAQVPGISDELAERIYAALHG